MDVPACTLVVRYQAPMDFRAYIQSKGRARHKTSQYIILVPDNDYISRYQDFQRSESILKSVIIIPCIIKHISSIQHTT